MHGRGPESAEVVDEVGLRRVAAQYLHLGDGPDQLAVSGPAVDALCGHLVRAQEDGLAAHRPEVLDGAVEQGLADAPTPEPRGRGWQSELAQLRIAPRYPDHRRPGYLAVHCGHVQQLAVLRPHPVAQLVPEPGDVLPDAHVLRHLPPHFVYAPDEIVRDGSLVSVYEKAHCLTLLARACSVPGRVN